MVLRLRHSAPSWKEAKCLGNPPGPEDDVFFDNSDEGYEDLTDEGVQFCNGTVDGKVCPIREECLIFALLNNEREGVWGGMHPADRKLLRKVHPWPGGSAPHPEWRWHSHDEITAKYEALPPKTRAVLDSDEED